MALISSRFPYIPLRIRLASRPAFLIKVDALVDTGFDGEVILPMGSVPDDLTPDTHVTWILADGFDIDAPAYAGRVEIVGLDGVHPVLISVLGQEPIVGRGLTDNFRVILDHGSEVIVEP